MSRTASDSESRRLRLRRSTSDSGTRALEWPASPSRGRSDRSATAYRRMEAEGEPDAAHRRPGALSVEYVRAGFRAVKIRIGRNPAATVNGSARARGRRTRGPHHVRRKRAARPAHRAAGRTKPGRSGIYWLEEPLPSQDLEGYRRLRAALPIPLALGEHVYSQREFIPYMANGAIDIVQPDACMMGGLSEAMKIGRVAESFGLAIAPHFMTPFHIHLAAALPRATYVEYYPFMDDLLTAQLVVEDGAVVVPTGPGHGIEFTARSMEAVPGRLEAYGGPRRWASTTDRADQCGAGARC